MNTKPTWRKHIEALTLAGGALVLAGCPLGGTCNANPDPCCSAPSSASCEAQKACEEAGGSFNNTSGGGSCSTDDAGVRSDLPLVPLPDLLFVPDASND